MTGSLFFDDDARVVMGRDVAKRKEGLFFKFFLFFYLFVFFFFFSRNPSAQERKQKAI